MSRTEGDALIDRVLIDKYGFQTYMLAREIHATCALEGNTLTIGEVIDIVLEGSRRRRG